MYRTEDLYLASALQQTGHPLQAVWKEGGRSTFEFEDTPELQQHVREYFSSRMQLAAHPFSERIRSAKSAAVNAPPRASE